MRFKDKGFWIYKERVFSDSIKLAPSTNHATNILTLINNEIFNFKELPSELVDYRGGIKNIDGDNRETKILFLEGVTSDDVNFSYSVSTTFLSYNKSEIVSSVSTKIIPENYENESIFNLLSNNTIRIDKLKFNLEQYSAGSAILKWFNIPGIQASIYLFDESLLSTEAKREVNFRYTKYANYDFIKHGISFLGKLS